MRRYLLIVIAAALLAPAPADGQFREPFPHARVSLTPVLGLRFPYTTRYEGTVFTEQEAVRATYRDERGGSEIVGGEAEVHIVGPLSLFGSVVYAPSAVNHVSEDGGPTQEFTGPTTWFLSAGVSLRLPEPTPDYRRFPLVASLTFAPGLVREVQRRSPLPPDHPLREAEVWQPINHLAANLGFKATVLLGTPRLAFQFGANDFITFWNARELEAQLEQAYLDLLGLDVIADYQLGHSHLFQAHVGFSLRF